MSPVSVIGYLGNNAILGCKIICAQRMLIAFLSGMATLVNAAILLLSF